MKIIKKTKQPALKANQFVTVGDQVDYQPPANHDGRGRWEIPPLEQLTVIKVNRFTFEAKDIEGNICRLDIREDFTQIKREKLLHFRTE
jgi:hypothetical protein